MRCAASLRTLELCVALPDRPAVFAGGMPYLGAKVFAAVAAYQFCGKGTVAMGTPSAVSAAGKF